MNFELYMLHMLLASLSFLEITIPSSTITLKIIMHMTPENSLIFEVHRRHPELIRPARPTPHEFKSLSDIDDQDSLRFQLPFVQFYPCNNSQQEKDPVEVVREALAKALVFYYPLAGRLREGPNRKLIVECNGEGVMFIEADADVTLDQFGDPLRPPFPCFEELLFNVPGTDDIINCPLLLIQVTRLRCRGFITAIRLNHTITDGFGLAQFMSTVGEIVRGASLPSTLPLWERHHLSARYPPQVTCSHYEYDEVSNTNSTIFATDDLVHASFFVKSEDISRLRKQIPPSFPCATTFEILASCVWKCRTIALRFNPSEKMLLMSVVSVHNTGEILLPKGYYGNSFVWSTTVAAAKDVASKPFWYVTELLKKTKENITIEYIRSFIDLMASKGRSHFTLAGSYVVSNVSHMGLENVDIGWGKAIFGGLARGGYGVFPGYSSFILPCKDKKGHKGAVIPVYLPKEAMRRFAKELENILGSECLVSVENKYSKFIKSAL